MQQHAKTFGLINRYRDYLPLANDCEAITLGEGNTPLIPLVNLFADFKELNLTVYAKFEGLNPTGSFKDRGMTVAISQAVYEGAKAVICASTGNTSAAAAAYAGRANLLCAVLIPEGKIAMGKLAQAMIAGAKVIQIKGNFDDGMQLVKSLADEDGLAIVNSINPYRLQGQKTAAFEIIDVLAQAPDYHCLPVGNAGNISAYWMGFKEYHEQAKAKQLPKLLGYQAEGAAPFLAGQPISEPETVASAIRIGAPQSWQLALDASRESHGWFKAISDADLLATQKLLATREGIFCEPASAISVAGLLADVKAGNIAKGSVITCTLTGHGLKDPDTAISQCQKAPIVIKPTLAEVKAVLAG